MMKIKTVGYIQESESDSFGGQEQPQPTREEVSQRERDIVAQRMLLTHMLDDTLQPVTLDDIMTNLEAENIRLYEDEDVEDDQLEGVVLDLLRQGKLKLTKSRFAGE